MEKSEYDALMMKMFEAGLRRIYREDLKPLDQAGIERLFGKPDQDYEGEEENADAE